MKNQGLDLLLKYFPGMDQVQISRFEALGPLYTEWNGKINLISRKDIDNLYERHILHSLAIAKVLRFNPGTTVLDVGSGGGFPGIPLAIFFPESAFTLVDSIGKKIGVVTEIIKALKLENVRAIHSRVEEVPGKFDFITGRAVSELNEFYGWVHRKIKKDQKNGLPNGILYLKGGDLNEELKPFGKRAELFRISDYFEEPYFETKSVVYIEGS